jgi:hypothetical protein
MSKSIASYPAEERDKVVARRIKQLEVTDIGIGCLGAMDALRHIPAARLTHETRAAYYDIVKKHDARAGLIVGVEKRR